LAVANKRGVSVDNDVSTMMARCEPSGANCGRASTEPYALGLVSELTRVMREQCKSKHVHCVVG
jgi:hypothetical protein